MSQEIISQEYKEDLNCDQNQQPFSNEKITNDQNDQDLSRQMSQQDAQQNYQVSNEDKQQIENYYKQEPMNQQKQEIVTQQLQQNIKQHETQSVKQQPDHDSVQQTNQDIQKPNEIKPISKVAENESIFKQAGHKATQILRFHEALDKKNEISNYDQLNSKQQPRLTTNQEALLLGSKVHVIFYEKLGKYDINFVFYKKKEDFYYSHFHTPLLDNDRDPSINAAASRVLYEKFYDLKFKDHQDYLQIQLDESTLETWQSIQEIVLETDLVKRYNWMDWIHEQYKVIFVKDDKNFLFKNHKQFQRYSVPIQDIDQDTQVDIKVKNLLKGLNLVNYVFENINQQKKYFCALICENIWNWRYLYECMYQGAWQGENEKWETFYVCNGEYPTDLNKYQGVVASGSHDHSYNLIHPWVPRYHMWLRKQYNLQSLPRFVTICFSHQSTAHTNQGKAAKMKIRMVNRYEQSYFTEEALNVEWVKNSLFYNDFKQQKPLYLFETHGDHVERMPKGAIRMLYSAPTAINSYYVPGKIFSMQFHAELNYTVMFKTFHDLIQTKHEIEEVLEEFDNSWVEGGKNDNHLSRYKFQELITQFLKLPRTPPIIESSDTQVPIDEKIGRKRGFLWDIIYNLGFLEEVILKQAEMEKVKQSYLEGGFFDQSGKTSEQKYQEYHDKKLLKQVKIKHMPSTIIGKQNPVNNYSIKQNDKTLLTSPIPSIPENSQQEFLNKSIDNKSLVAQKTDKEIMRERARLVKDTYKKLPAPKQQNAQENQNLSKNYNANHEKLQGYLEKVKSAIEKTYFENQHGKFIFFFDKLQGIDIFNSYWIVKRLFAEDGLIVLENQFFSVDYFQGILNKEKFQSKLKAFFPNRKKISINELLNFIEEWIKYDNQVILIHDKMQALAIQQNTVGKKFNKNEIKETFNSSISIFENIVKNCENKDDAKFVQKTLDFYKIQIQKFNQQQLQNQRLDTINQIYNYYVSQSLNDKGIDQQRFYEFAKDFRLYPLFIGEAKLLQIFNNSCSLYDSISKNDFLQVFGTFANEIMPDRDQSQVDKMDKFYAFMNIDDRTKIQSFMVTQLKIDKQSKQNSLNASKSSWNTSSTQSSGIPYRKQNIFSSPQHTSSIMPDRRGYNIKRRDMSPQAMRTYERSKEIENYQSKKENQDYQRFIQRTGLK